MDGLKTFSSKVGKGVLLAVGIPYGIVIVANLVYGWPCSIDGEGRYKRALQPARVLKVTYAVAEQVQLARFLPLYMKWTAFYKTANNILKDVSYGRNNNMLDVWTPKPITDHPDIGGIRTSPASTPRPVVVFVYGGAWGSGDKNMYGLLAQSIIDHLGAVVVVPNYSIFPKGDVIDMVNDLHDVLAFIQAPEFHKLAPDADQQKVILFGHSAGAHLCVLSTIDLAERLKSLGGAAKSVDAPSPNNMGDEFRNESSGHDEELHDTSSDQELAGVDFIKTTVETERNYSASELLSSVCGVVGLGGVYHIMDHYHHESGRGVEDLSPMWQAMKGMDQFDTFSPTERVPKMFPSQIRRLPPFYLIHGTNDKVVPPSSTEKFSAALTEQGAEVSLRMIVEGGHAELVIDLMEDGRKYHDAMVNVLMEVGDRVLKDRL